MADKTVRIDIVVDEDTKGAKKASEAVAGVRKESEKLDRQFGKTGESAKKLTHELKQLQTQRRGLAERLSSGGADADDQKEFNRINRRISWLKKLRAATRVADKSGENAMGSALDMGGEGIKPRNAAIGGLVVAAAGLSPAIGAIISGAFSGTVVGAAMAGGILAAAQDPSVQTAASAFGESISKEFAASGTSFVGPVVESLGILKNDFHSLNLGDSFAKAAPFVTIVAHGIGDLFKNIMPGFNKVLEKAGPYSVAFAEGLAGLGTALGDFMADLVASPGALEGLVAGFRLLNGTIIVLGEGLHWLSDMFDLGLRKNAEWLGVLEDVPLIGKWFAPLQDTLDEIAGSTQNVTAKTQVYGATTVTATVAAKGLTEALKTANDQFKAYYDIQASVDDTKIAARKGWIELSETLAENGKHWENNTKAGLANQAALRTQVELLKAQRDAAVEAADGNEAAIAKANREYDKAIAKLKEMADKAGITETAFNDLAGTYTVTFFVQQKAGAQVVAWSDLHNAERSSGGGKARQGSAAGIGYAGNERAAGGPVMAGVPYMINEKGRETVTFGANGMVHPASLTPMMGGGQKVDLTLRVVHQTPDGRVLRTELINDALGRGASQTLVAAAYP